MTSWIQGSKLLTSQVLSSWALVSVLGMMSAYLGFLNFVPD